MPDVDLKSTSGILFFTHPEFVGQSGLGNARASRVGEGALAFANFKNGPDWARTSDPALIKRML